MKPTHRITTALLTLGAWMLGLSDHTMADPRGVKPPILDFTQGTETADSRDWTLGPIGARG